MCFFPWLLINSYIIKSNQYYKNQKSNHNSIRNDASNIKLKIIESATCILIDNTQHILKTIEPHFPQGSSFTKTNISFRTDNHYKTEYVNTMPASSGELKLLEKMRRQLSNIVWSTTSHCCNIISTILLYFITLRKFLTRPIQTPL